MKDELNLIGDCVEAVYKSIDKSNTHLPITSLEKIVNSKTDPSSFEIIKTIAKGGYGEVFLVRKDKVYAMKRVPKEVILKQPNTALFMAEKQSLVDSIGSEWLVSAQMTLQDDDYLYYLMDFIPGGDFMGLLAKEDVLEEVWVRFYVVELVAALDELHKLGWIHRDLKPDNILIGLDGHIKLADFGSSIKMVNGVARSSFVVGTPDYVSPDILESANSENLYAEDIDFWTLGVIIYEMLFGATPFYSGTLVETYQKITNVDYKFPFKISEKIKDLITKLICKKESRLKIDDIKKHSFFDGVDWMNIKKLTPPFIPEVSSEYDTSNFVDTHFEIEKRSSSNSNFIDFVGFTYDPKLITNLQNIILDTDVPQDKIDISDNIEIIKKKENLQDIDKEINEAHLKLKEKKEEYKSVMMNILVEKEDLYNIENELQDKRKQIADLNNEISEKKRMIDEYAQAVKIDEVKNIKINFSESFENIFDIDKLRKLINEVSRNFNQSNMKFSDLEDQYQIIMKLNSRITNQYRDRILDLQNKISLLDKENNKLKKVGVDNLKKQVRIMTTEIKEYQQQINQELSMRKQLEEELKSIKNEKVTAAPVAYNQEFVCTLMQDRQKITSGIRIVDDMLYLNEKSCFIRNVYIQELKNNELYHESYKNRSLIIKLIFIKESVKSISSTGRRSIKSLEEDYRIECSMKTGLENMMPLLIGKQLEEARLQYEGTLKKISQLEREMEVARKSTLTEEILEDPIRLYEFNNHLFATKTFPSGTLCEHCNEVLYGVCDQGFECKDCKMVVHKSCYILGDVSCETYSAFKKGETFYILMRSIEEKERLFSVYKRF
ncbi:hypothetical protein P3W45_001500 [Vairimorpha bombi]